jgi:hypothetical protein
MQLVSYLKHSSCSLAGILAFTILVALLGMIAGSVSVFPLKDFFLEGFWQNFLSWTTLILFLFVPAIGLPYLVSS